MSDTAAGLLQVGLLIAAVAACYRPLGAYMARVYTSEHHTRVERVLYRVMGVDPSADQRWPAYARALLAFSAVSVLVLFALLRLQPQLPLSLGFPGVLPDQAFNTAASFVTNTNWQSYSGESTMGHLAQMSGLAVQNFVSAAVGMAVAAALVRAFVRSRTDRLGNFWVDLVRGSLRILLPIAVIGTVVLIALGVVQNLSAGTEVATLAGQSQTITGGPVASQEAIKELGTNGGGFYNANSSHPFENPNVLSNLLENFLLLLIPVSLTYTFGRMVNDRRQGYAILAAMGVLWGLMVVGISDFRGNAPRHRSTAGRRLDGGQGDPLRRGRVLTVGGLDHGNLHRGGQLVPLLVHRARRWPDHLQHGPGRGRAGRRRVGALRDARPGHGHGVRGRAHGGPHAGVPRQEGHVAGGQARLALHPHHARHRARCDRLGDRPARGEGVDPQRRPARPVGGAVRLHVGGQQQRFRLCGPQRQYGFLQHGDRAGHAGRVASSRSSWSWPWRGRWPASSRCPRTAGTLPTHRSLFVGMLIGVVLIVAGLTFFPVLALGPMAEGL